METKLSSYLVSHNLLVSSNPTIVEICCLFMISFGFPNPKKAGERWWPERFPFPRLSGYIYDFCFYEDHIPIENYCLWLSLSQLELEIMVSDGRYTLWTAFIKSCYDFSLHLVLRSLVLHGDLPSADTFAPRFRVELDASVWVFLAPAKWCFCFK